jgi:U3 small nucleolar ribonucleoprotein protein IMP3
MRRYHIQDREDYHKCVPMSDRCYVAILTLGRYNKLCGSLRSFAHRISLLPAQDPFRSRMEGQLLSKLYDMGVLNTSAKLSDVDNKLTVAAFCRRRLAVFMCMSKMAETVSAVRFLKLVFVTLLNHIQAVKFIEQGHVRVGPDTITDPAFLVSRYARSPFLHCPPLKEHSQRRMEDFVTWVDTSKLKRTIMAYNDEVRFRSVDHVLS